MSHVLREAVPAAGELVGATPTTAPFANPLLCTVWFALVAGFSETAILAVQRYALHRLIYRSSHYLWMPSVGAFIVFGAIVLIAWLLGAFVPALRRPRSIVGLLLGLTLFSTLMVGRWIGPLSALLLTIGCAVVLLRSNNGLASVARLVRRTSGLLVGVLLALMLTSFVLPDVRENGSIRRLAGAQPGAPNIIFLILDTVRARSLSLYGYERGTTPNIDEFAKQGVVFERAIAPAPWTLPSHASMFTGRPAHQLNANRFVALDDHYATLAEKLAGRGYATAGFVGNLAYGTREFGLGRGFHHWNDYTVGLAQIITNSSLGRLLLLERYSGDRNSWVMRALGVDQWIGQTRWADDVNAHLLDWMDHQRHRPFFIFANYFDAHWPYLPPQPFLGRFGAIRERTFAERLREERPGAWPKRGVPAREALWRDRYEESIAYVDSQVGALLRALRTRGMLDNTIVVITSDHGEEFGENGGYEHDTDVSFAQIRVPLVIVAPGRVPHGMRVQDPVGLGDLAATALQLSGSAPASLPGSSVSRFWTGQNRPASEPVLATLRKGAKSQDAIVTARYHYIRSANGRERLYDHVADIQETRDLSGSAVAAGVLPALRADLWRLTGGHPFPTARR